MARTVGLIAGRDHVGFKPRNEGDDRPALMRVCLKRATYCAASLRHYSRRLEASVDLARSVDAISGGPNLPPAEQPNEHNTPQPRRGAAQPAPQGLQPTAHATPPGQKN